MVWCCIAASAPGQKAITDVTILCPEKESGYVTINRDTPASKPQNAPKHMDCITIKENLFYTQNTSLNFDIFAVLQSKGLIFNLLLRIKWQKCTALTKCRVRRVQLHREK